MAKILITILFTWINIRKCARVFLCYGDMVELGITTCRLPNIHTS